MDKTTVKVEFSIIGEEFDTSMITDKLAISPTEYWKKGDKVKNKNITRKETCWEISTEYEESFDINDQLNKIVNIIKYKKAELKCLLNQYEIKTMFMIVINVCNNDKPAMYLDSEFIEFASEIKAEVDFDLYIY